MTPQPLRFEHRYGRAVRLHDRYVFNVPDPADHGHWMRKGGGEAGYEASAGKPGSGERISVTKDAQGYHMRHTDASGRTIKSIDGNKGGVLGIKGAKGIATLDKISGYARKHGVVENLGVEHFTQRALAAQVGHAIADGGGGHIGHLVGEIAGHASGVPFGGRIGGMAGSAAERGLVALLRRRTPSQPSQQHSELRFYGTYGRMRAL